MNIVYVLANANFYFLNLLDVTTFTPNLGGYASLSATSISGVHVATTQQITSVVVSNSSGIFMDLFTWSFPTTGCETIPTSVPAGAPNLSPSGTPQGSPQSSPQSNPSVPQNSPQNTPSTGGTNPDGSRSPEANIQQPNSPGGLPPTVDPVALGVGIAVPLAVLGVGAFLLVFFLRKRNKKKKKTNGVNQMNPLTDIDSAPPSVRPTDPGVYQNIPSNIASNNTYTSLGNVTNDTFATASAAIELPDIDKRLHIPYKSLVFIKEIGAGSYGKVFLG